MGISRKQTDSESGVQKRCKGMNACRKYKEPKKQDSDGKSWPAMWLSLRPQLPCRAL